MTDPLDALLNYYPLSPLILTAGQPTAEQFVAIRQAGCEVVINLATPASSSAVPNEAELVAAQGMVYIPIPVVWENPTLDDLARFFAAMQDHQDKKILVHCALNWRVSTFMYLYRTLKLGVPRDEAVWDLFAVWEPEPRWAEFVELAMMKSASVRRIGAGWQSRTTDTEIG